MVLAMVKLLKLPICHFRNKGAAWLQLCLLLPVLITRTSSATSLCTPSSRPAVCSPSFPLEGSRCYIPRPPPALMSPPPQPRSAALAEKDPSTGWKPEEEEERTSLRRKAPTTMSETADRRRASRPAWKPSPRWRSPQRTLTETPLSLCVWLT